MTEQNHFDIIIIGTGAGGGTLTKKLSGSGKQILILERGDFLPREKENWDTEEVFIKARYKANEEWLDKDDREFEPGIHYCVGGNTKIYGAALLRLREEDFGEVKHHDGVSPAWPLSYTDLKPWYLKAEKMYDVHGERQTDPTEPEEDQPYPHPPLTHEPRIQELFDDITNLGIKAFPLPVGVNLKENNSQGSLVLDRFDGFPDPTESKADSHVVGIKPAVKSENVRLLTNVFVEKLETNGSGTEIDKVIAKRDGEQIEFSADIVVVACGAVNSAALLLRSANEKHPDGLANRSGVVGRHYMAHNNSALLAISKKPNPTKFGKTFAINDYYFGSDDFDYPLGHIQMLGKSDSVMFREEAPSFTPDYPLDFMAKHALDFWLTSEDLPDLENRVTLTDSGQIRLSYTENNLEGHERLIKKLKWILKNSGCEPSLMPNHLYFGKKIPLAGTAHQCGTIRFGTDPEASALDTNCRAHDVENLYVVDGSFFPSSSAVNPGLTIMAMALRVGDHLTNEVL